MIPLAAVVTTGAQATVFESCVLNRTGKDHCDRASLEAPFSPCTIRRPRFTRVSDGKPWRRLLVISKKWVVLIE
jgi:hypothetical protein